MRLSYTPPPGWDFATVGDLAKPEKGSIRIGPFGSALKKHEYSENGIRVLGIEDVHPNEFLSDRCKYIPDAKFRELKQYEVSDGDVLVTNMGTVGRACVVPAGTQTSIISSHLIKVSLNRSRADPNYLCWMLNHSPLVVAQIRAKSHGAIMAGFNSSLLKSLRIPLPPLAEQKRIARILDAADALRTKRREALTELDTLLQSTFLDMFGDPVTNPMGWEVKPLHELLEEKLTNGAYYPKNAYSSVGTRMVHMANAFYGMVNSNEVKRVDAPLADIEKYGLESTDILVSRRSLNYEGSAKPCLIPELDEPLIFESSLIRVRPAREKVLTIYLFHFLSNDRARTKYVFPLVTRSTISGISQSNLMKVKVVLPPFDLQLRFAAVVESIEQQKASQRAHLAELDTLFASLQSRAFRGDL